ncbi:MAG: squalene/phytoene synthase family protein, partial [Chloroflexi bacterium]|nr:squalene/phytoene synthase family protein [Chloroflexota bacterium]
MDQARAEAAERVEVTADGDVIAGGDMAPKATARRPSPTVDQVDPEAAAVMARVARTFNLATSLLPAGVRRDVRRLYLVMRTLDDAVDRGAPDATEQLARVEAWAAGGDPDGREASLLDGLAA